MSRKKKPAPGRARECHRPNPVPRDGGDKWNDSMNGTKSQAMPYGYYIPNSCDFTGWAIEAERKLSADCVRYP